MTTWEQFLAALRADLQDTTSRWTDAMLYQYTVDAIRDYSHWFPRRADRVSLELVDGKYPLPVDFVDAVYVECPKDTFLKLRVEMPGKRFYSPTTPNAYFIEAGVLYLDAPASDEVLLTYHALHDLPANELDTTFVFTIPDKDMELPRLYVQAKIYGQMRSKQARLDRFKLGTGSRQDNPLEPEFKNLADEYQQKINDRIGGGIVKLTFSGRGG